VSENNNDNTSIRELRERVNADLRTLATGLREIKFPLLADALLDEKTRKDALRVTDLVIQEELRKFESGSSSSV
jgi:hypothetical protein